MFSDIEMMEVKIDQPDPTLMLPRTKAGTTVAGIANVTWEEVHFI